MNVYHKSFKSKTTSGIVTSERMVLMETNLDAVTESDENFSANMQVADAAGVAEQIRVTENAISL